MHSIFLPRASQMPSLEKRVVHTLIAQSKPRIQPVAKSDWPLWARAIAKFRREADTGLGDTIVHLIGDTRSERFQKWFQRKFGKSCGCTERQRWLNLRFPYL
jgi:hypothetical protein